MARRYKNLFSLARKRIRPSLNKLNIYNLISWRKNTNQNSQFRQLFFAKQEARSYHGPHMTETQFRNHFRPDLTSVSPLQSKNIRGKDVKEADIPHAMQTFGCLERRLDTAVYRAMFANSLFDAHNLIVRGFAKVNGVKVKHPGYILRAGDMFSVDPTRVLTSLGRQKPSLKEAVKLTNNIIRKFNAYIEKCRKHPEKMWALRRSRRRRHKLFNLKYEAQFGKRVKAHNEIVQAEMNKALNIEPRNILESILKDDFISANELISGKKKAVLGLVRSVFPPESNQKNFRELVSNDDDQQISAKDPKNQLSEGCSPGTTPLKSELINTTQKEKVSNPGAQSDTVNHISPNVPYEAEQAAKIAARYYSHEPTPGRSDVKKIVADVIKICQEEIRTNYMSRLMKMDHEPYDPTWVSRLPAKIEKIPEDITLEDLGKLKIPLPFSTTGKVYGLSEPSKPWFSPWTPRQFLAPLAVLPHHLEISFETCHAVYLRDPVARPGHAEVISPFAAEVHERAYMWYHHRRRKNLPRLD